jgi:hypothetical protein
VFSKDVYPEGVFQLGENYRERFGANQIREWSEFQNEI